MKKGKLKGLRQLGLPLISLAASLSLTTGSNASTKHWFGSTPGNELIYQSIQSKALADYLSNGDKGFSAAENLLLQLDKDALGKEFLLSGSIIPQSNAATSTALQGRIIVFKQFGDILDMYDVSGGTVVTEDLPNQRLLAQIPIIEDKGESLILDFNSGMQKIFTNVWISTPDSFSFSDRFDGAVANAAFSRVFEIDANSDRVVIRQLAAVEAAGSSGNTITQYEVRYVLNEYIAPEFTERQFINRHKHVGYFTTRARLTETEGRSYRNILRYEVDSETVPFFVSANTPEEYKKAVKDGILYWNKALGKEVITAEIAPEGITAPNADRNIVQWVPWDSAGFAYADIIADPRTGKIVRGQAYMTSVFAVSSISRARAVLADIERTLATEAPEKLHLGLKGMTSAQTCSFGDRATLRKFADGLTELLVMKDITDEVVMEFSKAYVAMVVAHEVGHIMGLRHNFAGNVASNTTKEMRDAELFKFSQDLNHEINPELHTSTSVMEYDIFPDAVFSGLKIMQGQDALPYDKAAVQYGYFGDMTIQNEKFLFCTDQDTALPIQDCRRFDTGIDALAHRLNEIQSWPSKIAENIFTLYVSRVSAKNELDRYEVADVALNSSQLISPLATLWSEVLPWLTKESRSLVVENKFPNRSELYAEEIANAYWEKVNKETESAGGIEKSFFSVLNMEGSETITPLFSIEAILADLKTILDSPRANPFVGLDGERYKFTQEEKEIILSRTEFTLGKVQVQLPKTFFGIVKNLKLRPAGDAATDKLSIELENALAEYALKILSTKGEKTLSGTYKGEEKSITLFAYDFETRKAAAEVLSTRDVGSYSAWSKASVNKAKELLKGEIKEILVLAEDANPDTLDITELSRELQIWYLNYKSIASLLAKI